MAPDPIPDAELLQLTVAELMARWPAAAHGFLAHRMTCVGCDFSGFDTLAEALEVHAVPQRSFLTQLRQAMPLAPSSSDQARQGGEA